MKEFIELHEAIEKIKTKIRLERITQNELASILKCSTNYISLMINEKRNLSDEILELIGVEKVICYRIKNKEVYENVGKFRKLEDGIAEQ